MRGSGRISDGGAVAQPGQSGTVSQGSADRVLADGAAIDSEWVELRI